MAHKRFWVKAVAEKVNEVGIRHIVAPSHALQNSSSLRLCSILHDLNDVKETKLAKHPALSWHIKALWGKSLSIR